ncbi:MAG: proteasome ATPase [Acidimicrobiales bacterium]|nr:proteasome ATPase [Acidimicrobiales bacterium]
MDESHLRQQLEDAQLQLDEVKRHAESLVERNARLKETNNLAPRRIQLLEGKLKESKKLLMKASSENEKLVALLTETKEQISKLKTEVEKLSKPPSGYGVFLGRNADGTVDVHSSGRKLRVSIHPELEGVSMQKGQEVVLNESLNVILARQGEKTGEIVTLKEILPDGKRALVKGRTDQERIVDICDDLQKYDLSSGALLLCANNTDLLIEEIPKPELEDHILAEIPDVTYADIGGLDTQISQITDAVELPFLHSDLFAEHELPSPKGVLLYGPPGCGKTLIAKAVANSLASKIKGSKEGSQAKSYFYNIKGPELLNKYVGETERQIRLIFENARSKSTEGWPVIIFFDEMESLFRIRGSGISSDMESTVVPQLLAEIDGVDTLKNVIIIGASNREDLIDPAILRPGRLDLKIRIDRPNQDAAVAIFSQYLNSQIPISSLAIDELGGGDTDKALRVMVERSVEEMYATEERNEFLEVTYQNGDKEVLYFKDFASGAMIENIVRRAKKLAIKRFLESAEKGLTLDDFLKSIRKEFSEQEDLPNTTNPDDWAKVSGKKGERITFIRTLFNHDEIEMESQTSQKSISGQYL